MTLVLQQLINGLSRGSVYALIAVGFALIFSVLKFSNFAHGGLMSVCAFAGYYFSGVLKLNPVLSVLLTACVGAALGVLLDTIAFKNLRRRKSPGIYYFVSSITAGLLFMNILTIFFGLHFYVIPTFFVNSYIKMANIVIIKNDIMIFLVSMLCLIALILILNKTSFGLALRATSMEFDTAKLMGININRVVIITFLMAGALGGVAGIFLGLNFTVVPSIGGDMMVKGFIASIIGGLGSISGAIEGALLLGIAEVVLTVLFGDNMAAVFIFVFTLIFLLIRPQGVSGKNIEEKA